MSDELRKSGTGPQKFTDPARIADAIVEKAGKKLVMALPLGLGKANHIVNALFARATADPSIHLTIFTALTLEPPHPKSDLEHRFFDPVSHRLFGGYPALAYAEAIRKKQVPPNVVINEFSLRPGSGLVRLTHSSTTFQQTIPTRCATCLIAASMSSASSWRIAPPIHRRRTA
jgi:hypothetical protein